MQKFAGFSGFSGGSKPKKNSAAPSAPRFCGIWGYFLPKFLRIRVACPGFPQNSAPEVHNDPGIWARIPGNWNVWIGGFVCFLYIQKKCLIYKKDYDICIYMYRWLPKPVMSPVRGRTDPLPLARAATLVLFERRSSELFKNERVEPFPCGSSPVWPS